jgi:hypothetical protein
VLAARSLAKVQAATLLLVVQAARFSTVVGASHESVRAQPAAAELAVKPTPDGMPTMR